MKNNSLTPFDYVVNEILLKFSKSFYAKGPLYLRNTVGATHNNDARQTKGGGGKYAWHQAVQY